MVQNLISQVSLALPTIINQMISKLLMLFSNFGLIDLQLMPLAVFNKIGTWYGTISDRQNCPIKCAFVVPTLTQLFKLHEIFREVGLSH
nr:MAG TPA: hypothetical protein [Bacteriophage sp.]